MNLPGYTNASSFTGTATANLAVNSSGDVITVSTSGAPVFPYNGNAVITGSLTTTGIIYAQPNGGMYFQGGDDAALYDINVVNTMGVYGVQDSTIGSIKLGSGGGTISGRSGNIGINTTTPTSASLHVSGNIFATSFTGSLFGTSSFATTSSYAATASVSSTTFGIGATIQTYGSVASSIVGSNNLFSQNTGSYTSAFFKYTATSGSNTRAGEVISVWNGTTTSYTDFSTVDIGNTNNVTASISIVTGQVQFNIQTNSSGWAIKSIATFM
jgi:hypothetical protein